MTVVLFAPGITDSFSSDDYVHLSRNSHFASLGEALGVFVTTDGREYRPLVRLSIWLNSLMTDTALSFKVTNLVLHLLAVCLIYALVRAVCAGPGAALAAAAFFALHPIHTTSVHFIMGRTDLLASVYYLGALLSLLRWRQHGHIGWFLLGLTATLAALASKELAVTLPVVMLWTWWAASPPSSRRKAAGDLVDLASFFLVTLIYVALRVVYLPDPANVEAYTNFSLLPMMERYAEWSFAALYPFDLYSARHLIQARPDLVPILWTALAIGVAALLLWRRARGEMTRPTRLLWLGCAWFVITLLPMAGGNAHRWYLYLPSAGLALVFGSLWVSVSGSPSRLWGMWGVAVLLSAYAIETGRQSLIWREQHRQSERFFKVVEDSGMLEHQSAYLANVPFGYKSAFLFSFDSLQYALERRYGHAPRLFLLSYINLGDRSTLTMRSDPPKLTLQVQPDAFEFFLLPPAQRNLASPVVHSVGDFSVSADRLSQTGHIQQLTIERVGPSGTPLYIFDGERLRAFGQ